MNGFKTETMEKYYKANKTRRVRITDRTPDMLIKWVFPGLVYVLWL